MLIRLGFVLLIQLLHKSSGAAITCESGTPSQYCNPTQRNCFVEREEPLRLSGFTGCIRYTKVQTVADFPDRWQCPGCSRRLEVSSVAPTRPTHLRVERSVIPKGTKFYNLTVSWEDPSSDGSDSTNTGYEIRLEYKPRAHPYHYWGSPIMIGRTACECLPLNKTEFTFHNVEQVHTDELVKVEVIKLPYHYLSQDCSTSTVIFFPGREKNQVLRNPQHCDVHTPVRDVATETSLIAATGGGGVTGKMRLRLSWNSRLNNVVFFVMVTDPLVNPQPSCRNHGDNPPCFVTNSMNVTIWPLDASRKYHIYVEAAYKCDALTGVEEYDGCGECCQAVEVSPLLTRLPLPHPTPTAGPLVEATVAAGPLVEATVADGLQPALSSPPSQQQKSADVTSLSARPVPVVPTGYLNSRSLRASPSSFWLLGTSRARAHTTSTATGSSEPLSSTAVAASARVALPVSVDGESHKTALIVGPLVGGVATVVVVLAVLVLIFKMRRRHSNKPQEENNFNTITITHEQRDGFKDPHVPPPVKKIVLQLGLENPTPSDLVYKPPLQHETPSDTPTPQSEIQVPYLEETESASTDDTPSTPPSTSASLCLARAPDPTSVVIQPYGCTLHSCVHGSPPPTPSYSRGSPLIRRSFAIPSAFVCFSSKSPGEEIKVIQQLLIRDLSSEYGIHVTASEMGRGNLPKWVESQCRDATAVLCVCNKALFEEWEQPNTVIHCVGRQVYAAASEGGSKPEKFTVVLLKQSDRQFIPSSYLRDIQAFIVTEFCDIAGFIRKVPPYVMPTPSTH